MPATSTCSMRASATLRVRRSGGSNSVLITRVRDKKGEGHAVLTVKTDKGEFILDNQNENVVAWTETGYRFVKRQSQSDPNVWVSLGDGRPAVSTASAKEH